MTRIAWGDGAPVLELVDVVRSYSRGGATVGPCSLSVYAGSTTALVGRSGSGKSTILNCAAGILRPTEGEVRYRGSDIARLRDYELARLRREEFGFVFQDYTLIDALSVAENISLPLRMSRRPAGRSYVASIAERLGIGDILDTLTSRLSGGQRQRVAIARAIAVNASVLFADEPTGALDAITREEVLSVLLDPALREGRAIIIATHDVDLACVCDRVLVIDGGTVAEELVSADSRELMAAMRRIGR